MLLHMKGEEIEYILKSLSTSLLFSSFEWSILRDQLLQVIFFLSFLFKLKVDKGYSNEFDVLDVS